MASRPGACARHWRRSRGSSTRSRSSTPSNPVTATSRHRRSSASMDVKAGGTTLGSFTHAYGPAPVPAFSPAVLSYDSGQASFTASGATTQLDFVSTDAPRSAFGIVLDAVRRAVTLPCRIATRLHVRHATPSPLSPAGLRTSPRSPTSGGSRWPGRADDLDPAAGQGVSADLHGATVVAGSPATLDVTASADAVPGVYTATVTGTLGSCTRTRSPSRSWSPRPSGSRVLSSRFRLTSARPMARSSVRHRAPTRLFLTGMVNGPPNTTYDLTFSQATPAPTAPGRRADSRPDARSIDGASQSP